MPKDAEVEDGFDERLAACHKRREIEPTLGTIAQLKMDIILTRKHNVQVKAFNEKGDKHFSPKTCKLLTKVNNK
ncbi:CLUMA_CG003764, isoform A [Clunio marinus]|uniref:CLUMA_CG003764, isoform A n=1 Tax=Clunio marinus TaxID=568069 RepID=A0A1J1HPQ9_9DIPT|nr:CLUMA_CG003764, isoform A [Clunio marinus]